MCGEIADDMVDGSSCSGCGIYFVESHGYPVLCKVCFHEMTNAERAGLPKATNKEAGDD